MVGVQTAEMFGGKRNGRGIGGGRVVARKIKEVVVEEGSLAVSSGEQSGSVRSADTMSAQRLSGSDWLLEGRGDGGGVE